MDTPIVLFDHTSANLDSPVFELDTQRTVVGIGLQPGDYITFEVITVAPAARAKICGCRILAAGSAMVDGLQELVCPSCESEDTVPAPVKLTAANPVVILDSPQGSLIRAMYHGTGVGLRTVTVWTTHSDVGSLTAEMRGCIPLCCVDDVWTPTGLHRCGETLVEIEEISNCGNKRWTECGDVSWTPTGATFCTDNGGDGGGEDACVLNLAGFDNGPGYYAEVRNQCGVTRWEYVCGVDSPSYFAETGLIRCQLDEGGEGGLSGTVFEQVVNPCGRVSWRERGPMTFTLTGNVRCDLGGDSYDNEVRDDCGNLHWQDGGNLAWTATGNSRCAAGFIEIEERSQPCGYLRWTTTTPVTWVATGATRCTSTAFEGEERDNCGNLRWVFAEALNWLPTGNYDCRSTVNWREERNQCGTLRWINTGAVCGTSGHTMTSLTPQAASVIEGETACWNIVLNTPVIGTPLTIEFDLSGADQTRNNYSSPRSITIPVGQTTGTLCITTTDDTVVDGTEQLCVTPRLTERLTNAPATSCINVLDNDVPEGASEHTVTWGGEGPDDVTEGEEACWDIELDGPVTVAPLTLVFDWTGTDAVRNGYPNSTVTIAVGDSTGMLCLTTTDDTDIDGTETLCPVLLPNVRVTSGPGASCIDVLDNDIASSVHEITCVNPPAAAVEGTLFCWNFTLDAPVTGAPLTVTATLTGSETGEHSYPAPSVVVPVGESTGTLCVQTIDDNNVEPTRQLCLTINTSSRITAVNDVSCVSGGGQASIFFTNVDSGAPTINEGQVLNLRVSLSATAVGGDITGTVVFSGSEKTAYPSQYPDLVWTVEEGNSYQDYLVTIYDDAIADGNTALYGTLSVATAGWTVGVASAAASIIDNEGGGTGGAPSGGGGCYMTGTMLRTPTGYVGIDSLLPGDELLAFALPGMPNDYDGDWASWRTDSLDGLSYPATAVKSNKPFVEQGAVSINSGPHTTGEHRYFVFDGAEYGWRRAAEIDTRHALVTTAGNVQVETVEHIEGEFTFFHLDVEAPDTLIAKAVFGDVLAHNMKCMDCPEDGSPHDLPPDTGEGGVPTPAPPLGNVP